MNLVHVLAYEHVNPHGFGFSYFNEEEDADAALLAQLADTGSEYAFFRFEIEAGVVATREHCAACPMRWVGDEVWTYWQTHNLNMGTPTEPVR